MSGPNATVALLLATLEALGTAASEAAADEIMEFAGEADSFSATALEVVAQAIEKHGQLGIDTAIGQIMAVVSGKLTELDVSDARSSHALLAAIEREEGLNRRKVREWHFEVGQILGSVGLALVSGVAMGALGALPKVDSE